MVLATATVHTAGINLESMAVIVGSIVASLGFLTALQTRRTKNIRDDIANAVNNLANVLEAKLETKERVNELSVQFAETKGLIRDLTNQVNRMDSTPRGRSWH